MAKVMLIEGPVGAGKSTYAKALGRRINAPHLKPRCVDEQTIHPRPSSNRRY